MRRREAMQQLLQQAAHQQQSEGRAFACSNIALIKYWGKRNTELNLPVTDSLSMGLNHLGAHTTIQASHSQQHQWVLNGQAFSPKDPKYLRLARFLDDMRPDVSCFYRIESKMNIPIAAGIASSACGFASVVKALNAFHGWQLPDKNLSQLARMGSGSACRSLWHGFVHWHAGVAEDGHDSFAEPLNLTWPNLRIGLLCIDDQEKAMGSTEAMLKTQQTAFLYAAWPQQVKTEMASLLESMQARDFHAFGQIVEHNALSMHALMLSANPPIIYSNEKTLMYIKSIWACRQSGLALYFSQDAGPNLKCFFLSEDTEAILAQFPNMHLIPEAPLTPAQPTD